MAGRGFGLNFDAPADPSMDERAGAFFGDAAERAADAAAAAEAAKAFAKSIEMARANADRLSRGLKDGSLRTLERQTLEMAKLRKEAEKVRREVELTAKYGERRGGFLARHEGAIGAAGRLGTYAAGTALAVGTGMVHRGFAGTTQSARLDLEYKLASRELAGAFVPAMETATRGLRGFRQWLEKLSPAGQSAVQYGGLALAGALGGQVLSQRLTGQGLAANGAAVIAAGGGGIKGAAKIGAAAFVAGRAIDKGGYAADNYQISREVGNSKFKAGVGAFASWIADNVGLDASGKIRSSAEGRTALERIQRREAADSGKTKVIKADGGTDELGAGYERLSTALAMVDRSLEDKSDREILQSMLDELRKLTGRDQSRVPGISMLERG